MAHTNQKRLAASFPKNRAATRETTAVSGCGWLNALIPSEQSMVGPCWPSPHACRVESSRPGLTAAATWDRGVPLRHDRDLDGKHAMAVSARSNESRARNTFNPCPML